MGTLRVLGSSSKGNCYILENGKEKLIIELGIKWSEVKKALGYNFSGIVGAIVSHRHGDHSKSVSDAMKDNVTVYSNADVVSINDGVKLMELGVKTNIGGFSIQPVPLNHDVECYGYLIEADKIGRVLFATDTSDIDYTFKNINHYLVESNYSDEVLTNQFANGGVNVYTRNRVSDAHLSLEKAIRFINACDSKVVKTIVLLHLSDGNSDAEAFVKDVRKYTKNLRVYIADKDMEIDLPLKNIF